MAAATTLSSTGSSHSVDDQPGPRIIRCLESATQVLSSQERAEKCAKSGNRVVNAGRSRYRQVGSWMRTMPVARLTPGRVAENSGTLIQGCRMARGLKPPRMFLTGGGGDGQGGLGPKSRAECRSGAGFRRGCSCTFCFAKRRARRVTNLTPTHLGWQTPNYKMGWSQKAVLEDVAQALVLASG
jgi:hypothetical protein